eukprot:14048298-Alexandrium_andersonii.AAC.1
MARRMGPGELPYTQLLGLVSLCILLEGIGQCWVAQRLPVRWHAVGVGASPSSVRGGARAGRAAREAARPPLGLLGQAEAGFGVGGRRRATALF